MMARLAQSIGCTFLRRTSSQPTCRMVAAIATAVATKMSQIWMATKKRATGKRSYRNFMRGRAFYQSLPATERLARLFVSGPHHQAAGRDADGVFRAVRHRHVHRAAIERIGERQIAVMPPYDRPQIDTRLVGKGMDGTRRAALLRDVGIATGEALQTIDRIEAEQGTEGAPLQHPRIDLPFVAAQLELLRRRRARPHRHRVLPLGKLAPRDARRLLLVCQARVR